MSDYTCMSAYYDLIMTSGYYDYAAVTSQITRFDQVTSILEVGAGTGLILEQLVAQRPEAKIAGIDLTAAMLEIAAERLARHPQISLHQQDVITLDLDQQYDLAFSYGGVWYFVPDPSGETFSMISHIRAEPDNQTGFERLAAHLPSGATLLLGVQAPHADYARAVSNGMQYAQTIAPITDGFRKHYSLSDQGRVVMEQTTDYRVYAFDEALALLDKVGFDYCRPSPDQPAPALFLEFTKR